VDVKKRAGENLINASDKINVILKDAKANVFPEDLVISLTGDQSRQTRVQVSELENSIIFGMLLVILVLLFFLGLRNALFVGIAIPLSMFIAFMVLGALGVTLNMMVLFSLVLALGMLVDNGIVVVENIYRLMDEGMSPIQAARYGVGEVALPIIASTATTLAAFLPLAIWPGLMGEFMYFLPMTLMIVLASSLFVALVINPVFTAVFMKLEEKPTSLKKLFTIVSIMFLIGFLFVSGGYSGESAGMRIFGNLLIFGGVLAILNKFVLAPSTKWFQTKGLPFLERGYNRFLGWALSGAKPVVLLLGTFGLLVCSIGLVIVFQPLVVFFPNTMPNFVNVFIEAPIGTDIEEVNVLTKELEQKVRTHLEKYDLEEGKSFLVESVIAQVGEGTSDPAAGPSMAQTPHKARIAVSFVGFADREDPRQPDKGFVMTNEVLEDIREIVKGIPGVAITVDKEQNGPPQGKPINMEIVGDDYNQLLAEALNVKRYVDSRNIPGIEELKLDVEVGKPEMPIIIDRAKARRFNLSTAQVGMSLRNALFGLEVPGSFKDGEDDYKIMVRLKDKYRYDPDALMNQKITFRDQMTGKIRQIPISAVATAEKSSTFSSVKRKDQKRIITVASNVLEGYNANEVVAEIKEALADYDMPEENTLKFTGQQEEQAKEMSFLGSALVIAVFLIFLIMVSQFNSAATPLIIVTSVVFSLIGVLLGLLAFGMEFVIIMTMVGIISLAGIVVNNAIVLIDYTKLIITRKEVELGLKGHEHLSAQELLKSVVEGGKTRLRPVLLTAITTILGLFPLALGLNINFFSLLSDYDPQIYIGGDNVAFWGPMSYTVIFGLTFATFLTLVIVPVMFLISQKIKYRLKDRKAKSQPVQQAPRLATAE